MRKRATILAVIASLIGVATIFKGYYASESDWKSYRARVDFYETTHKIAAEQGIPTLFNEFPHAPNEPTEKEKMVALVALSSAGVLFVIGFLAGPVSAKKENDGEPASQKTI